jgi:hypothetical protein
MATSKITDCSFSDEREETIRTWLAKKESVCPYAPGLARFTYLPKIDTLNMEGVRYFANELSGFYKARKNNKRVGRWILLPHQNWTTHADAFEESERLFWLLNAAYYYHTKDKLNVKKALHRLIDGIEQDPHRGITNPIIGKLPCQNAKVIPPRTLFCTAMSPLYSSDKFYRYSPESVLFLIYLSEFKSKQVRHPDITKRIAIDMAFGSILEHFGDEFEPQKEKLEHELPIWGALIEQSVALYHGGDNICSPDRAIQFFQRIPSSFITAVYQRFANKLTLLPELLNRSGRSPKTVLSVCFAGSGLYVTPCPTVINPKKI